MHNNLHPFKHRIHHNYVHLSLIFCIFPPVARKNFLFVIYETNMILVSKLMNFFILNIHDDRSISGLFFFHQFQQNETKLLLINCLKLENQLL